MRIAKPILVLLAGVAVAPLAACKMDNRPLLARFRGEPAPAQYAALPQPGGPYEAQPAGYGYPAPPPPLADGGVRRIAYAPDRAWPAAQRVYALDRAFYDLPPDYGFAYGDEEPWAWEAADDSLMFAEPWGDAYRFYYYEPGEAYPYFVTDPDYGYAYGPDGVLLAVFSAAGALLAADSYDRYYPSAEQYWSRGLDLRRAYGGDRRYAVNPTVWSQRAPLVTRYQAPWIRAGDSQPAWREWRSRSGQDFVQRYAPERQRRVAGLSRSDNGRHLGWEQGRHVGWANGGGPPMLRGGEARQSARVAEARAPERMRERSVERLQGPRGPDAMRQTGRAPEQRGHGHFQAAQDSRPHGGGRPERMAEAAPQRPFHMDQQVRGGGHDGHGPRGGGGGPPQARFAEAAPPAPPVQARGNPHGGGEGHGGQRVAEAQQQPQAAPPQPHGGPHGGGDHPGGGPTGNGGDGGNHGKGGQGGGGGGGDDRGHGHGHGR